MSDILSALDIKFSKTFKTEAQKKDFNAMIAQLRENLQPIEANFAEDTLYPTMLTMLVKDKLLKIKKGEPCEVPTTEMLQGMFQSPFQRALAEKSQNPIRSSSIV